MLGVLVTSGLLTLLPSSLGVPGSVPTSSTGLGKREAEAFSGVGVPGMVRDRRAGAFSAGVAIGTGEGWYVES